MVAGLLTGIIIARTLGPDGKGEIALFLINVTILTQIVCFGIPELSVLNYSKKNNNKKTIIFGGLLFSSIIFLISCSVILILNFFFNYNLLDFSLLIIATSLFEFVNTQLRHYFLGTKQILTYNINVFSQAIFYLLFLIIVFFSNSIDLYLVIISIIFSKAICFLHLFYKIKQSNVLSEKIKRTDLRKYIINIFQNSFYFFLVSISSTINQRIVYFFVDNNFSKKYLGIYSVGEAFPNLIGIASSQISFVLYPYLVNEKEIKKIALLYTSLILTFIIGLFSLIFMFFFGEQLILLVYGNEFTDSYNTLLLLTLALTFYSMNNSLFNFYISKEKIKLVLKIILLSIIVLVSLLSTLLFKDFIYASISVAITNCIIFLLLIFNTILKYPPNFKLNNFLK